MVQRFICRVAEVEFPTLAIGAFLRTARSGLELRLAFAPLDGHFEGYGASLRVSGGIVVLFLV